MPRWTKLPPAPGTYRAISKWGASERFKHPSPGLYNLLKEKLGMSDADFMRPGHLGNQPVALETPPSLEARQIACLTDVVGPQNVSIAPYDRIKFGSGQTAMEILSLRKGEVMGITDLVVHPRHERDVEKVVAFCHEERIPLNVYGGGTSVTLGFQPVRGGVTLVTRTHLNRVLTFNEVDQTVTVQSGILGPDYEKMLNRAPEIFDAKYRYTGGHFPQSFEYATIGGWIAALGSGQQSSYYGDVTDLVLSQDMITPAGRIRTLNYPAMATGPKVNDMLKGSEGTFGVLVSATMRVFRYLPHHTHRFAFIFPSWDTAISAARQISQGEFGMPSMLRISDPVETDAALAQYGIKATVFDRLVRLKGFSVGSLCLFLGRADGEKGFAKHIKRRATRICRTRGAMPITGFPVKHWEKSRFHDPYLREDLNDFGIVIDTLETGVTWSGLKRLYQGVTAYIRQQPETICLTHASHFYPQGTNLYFIVITRTDDVAVYRRFQAGVIDRILNCGGSLSHHHGIGRLMAPWMDAHLGKTQMEVLRTLKRHFDPNGIMNPGGTLGLD